MSLSINDATGSVLRATTLGTTVALNSELNSIKGDLVTAINNIDAAGKVTMDVDNNPEGYLKAYSFYQGVLGTDDATAKAAKLIGTINIPKDLVVQSGSVVVAGDGTGGTEEISGATAGDKYLKLVIANQQNPVYIAVKDLVDVYTGTTDATGITITVGNDNSISATCNISGSATIASVSDGVVTLKTGVTQASGAVSNDSGTDITLAKVATTGAAVDVAYGSSSNVKAALDTLMGADTVAGSVAKAEKDAKAYADGLVEGLDTTSDVGIASKSGDVVTIKGSIKQEDGLIAQGSASDITLEEVAVTGAAADVSIADTGSLFTATTVEGALAEVAGEIDGMDAVADATKTAIDGSTARTATNSGVFALQSITEADGKITGMTAVEVDAAGTAASEAASALATAIGESTDTASADTINGAKAYADNVLATVAGKISLLTSGDSATVQDLYNKINELVAAIKNLTLTTDSSGYKVQQTA